jgi:hypothetical protein
VVLSDLSASVVKKKFTFGELASLGSGFQGCSAHPDCFRPLSPSPPRPIILSVSSCSLCLSGLKSLPSVSSLRSVQGFRVALLTRIAFAPSLTRPLALWLPRPLTHSPSRPRPLTPSLPRSLPHPLAIPVNEVRYEGST